MNKGKALGDYSRKELDSLPERGWNEDIGEFDSLIILPLRGLHESGFRKMDFVAVKDNTPFCRLSGCSDVIHIDGIGGRGEWRGEGGIPSSVIPKGWSIDCLKKSGLLRLFCAYSCSIKAGLALSSFEVFGVTPIVLSKINVATSDPSFFNRITIFVKKIINNIPWKKNLD